jgi:hypothetical protein
MKYDSLMRLGIVLSIIAIIPVSTTFVNGQTSTMPTVPKVTQKTMPEMMTYVKSLGPKMNVSRLGAGVGNVSDIEAALYGDNTYVALIASNSTDRNHVYLQLSRSHPLQFSSPIELTNSSRVVNASHLGIVAYNKTDVVAIWQDTNNRGIGSIWLSASNDSGNTFKTYKQSIGNSDAKDPKIITDGTNIFYSWLQQTSQNCVLSTSSVGSNTTAPTSMNASSNGNTSTTCSGGEGHGGRW